MVTNEGTVQAGPVGNRIQVYSADMKTLRIYVVTADGQLLLRWEYTLTGYRTAPVPVETVAHLLQQLDDEERAALIALVSPAEEV